MGNDTPAFTAASQTDNDQLLLELYRYIDKNYATCTLSGAAEHLHHNFYWLSHEIKRRTGRNFTDIIQERRLEQARQMLLEDNMNIADISVFVGYDNVSYFRRLFAKRFGCTPNAYRKENLREKLH